MDCKRIGKMFQKYMDEEIGPEAGADLERHFSGCPVCAEKYAGSVQLKRGLSSVQDEPLPAGFHSAWTAKLQELSIKKAAERNGFLKYRPAFAAGIAAVAIISAALLSGVLTQSPDTANSRREITAAQDASEAVRATPPEMMMGGASPEQNAAAAEEGALFMAQDAPSEAAANGASPASSETAASKSEADARAEPLQIFVPRKTFEGMIFGFDEWGITYTLDGGNVFVTVTDDNQDAVAAVFKDYQLELYAASGGVFEFSISE